MTELRAPLVDALHRAADDLALGRFEDPHVGFLVLVHPDREPEIVLVSAAGAHPLARVTAGKPGGDHDHDHDRARSFSWDDLAQADLALGDARAAGIDYGYQPEPRPKLGTHLAAAVRDRWHRRRDNAAEAEMKTAAEHAKRPHVCPHCGERFTPRGYPMHLERAPYCAWRERTRLAAEAEAAGT